MAETNEKLWNRRFSAFAAGTLIEYISNAGMSFVLSLLILDLTNSVLMYGSYLVLYYLSSVCVPMLVGPLLEKYNKRVVNCLCCILSAAVYGAYFLLYLQGKNHMAFTLLLAVCTGILHATFSVGANALMLEITHKANLQKAYSILSMIDTVCEISVPVVTVLYKMAGLSPIMIGCILLFAGGAAVMLAVSRSSSLPEAVPHSSYAAELKDGMQFVAQNRGYLVVCIAFALSYAFSGVRRTLWLPFFQNQSESSYIWYFVVSGLCSTGMFHASFLLYLLKIKEKYRYLTAAISFVLLGSCTAGVLFSGKIVAVILGYFAGLASGIFSNMRSVSVYAHLDENQQARFSGIFTAFTNLGMVLGMASCSVLSEALTLPAVGAIFSVFALLAFGILFLFWGRDSVRKLYNT